MAKRFPFPGLPNGWYVVATSDEIRPGKLLHRRYFEREIILFRTASGDARVADAYCPHMGAHLGRVGKVHGDGVRCGFHGFEYDGTGRCVATPYDGPPPPAARLGFWESREQNGFILVWFDALGRPPTWEVPVLDESGYTGPRWRRFDIPTHPQETTENSVDFGHFTQIHGFVDGSIIRDVEAEGPLLKTSYRAFRPLGIPGLPRWKVQVDYDVWVWGLGFSQVDVRVSTFHLNLRIWVLPVPRDEEHIDLIIAVAGGKNLGPLSWLGRFIGHQIVCGEVEQDLDVWTYKDYLERPALAKGDGPIAYYRNYAKQFYPQLDQDNETSARVEAALDANAPAR